MRRRLLQKIALLISLIFIFNSTRANYDAKDIVNLYALNNDYDIEDLISILRSNFNSLDEEVKGMVTDTGGTPVPGVTVFVKDDRSIGTATDVNGRFILEAPTGSVLVFRMVGFETEEVPIPEDGIINIQLRPNTSELEETVVVAFGKKKKTEVVGSQTTINPQDLKIPSSNLTAALAGKISGIIAFQSSGEPGQDNANFFVRGITTFGYNKNPLILIDNIEVTSTDLARLQPDDIESFSVMKDATATALYGSRAANGVILITTKEGEEGKVNLSLRLENSWSQNTKNVKLADPLTYMELENESILTRNPLGVLSYSQNKIDNTRNNLDPILYPQNDWMSQLIKKTTSNQRANLNINGGGKIARYYVSGSYDVDNGILKVDQRNNFNNNISLKTYQLRSNININITNSTEMIVRLGGLFDEYRGPIDGGSLTFRKILGSNPVLFPPYFPDNFIPSARHPLFGNSSVGVSGSGGQAEPNFINPYADMVKGYRDYTTSDMSAQFEVKQDLSFFIKGLSVRGLFNTSRYSHFSVSRFYNPYFYEISGYDPNEGKYNLSFLNESSATDFLDYEENSKDIQTTTYMEAAIDYYGQFGNNEVSGMIVGTRRNQLLANQGDLQKSLPYRNQGISGRFTYTYSQRYVAEFNFGYNGSERFDKNHRYGFFPSFGLAYNISQENFWEKTKRIIPSLKFRMTYGLIGNDAIGSADDRFFYLSQVNMDDGARFAEFGTNFDYKRNGITVNRFSNSSITWETAKMLNFGIDFTLFNGMDFTAEYYQQKRDNILMNRAYISEVLGFSAPIRANVGKASGSGVDLSLDYGFNVNQGWWVKMQGNFTYAHDKYDFFEEPDYSKAESHLRHEGRPISQQWGLIAERLFIDEKDVANSPVQNFGEYGAGDIKFRDVNGDGEITDLDRVPIGLPTTPEIIYGFGLSTGYRNFDFSFFFQGSGRSSFWIDPQKTAPFIPNPDLGEGSQNALLKMYADSYWSEEHRDIYAVWPRLSHIQNENNEQRSTWFMRDGSFLRLKSVELGYSFSQPMISRVGLNNLRVYVNTLNLLCFSKFKAWDIEMGGNGLGYPIQRVFNVGVLLGF